MSEPIDYIDLTEDSPLAQRLLNARNRNCANLPKRREKSKKRTRSGVLEDTIVICAKKRKGCSTELNTNYSDAIDTAKKKDVTDGTPVEIIELDDTIVQEKTAACLTDDNVKGNLLMLTCPICLEQLSTNMKPTSTRCGHIFCMSCLQQAIAATKKCPTCKAAVRLRGCTRLYF